ncbi:hypothetical protein RJ640_024505 [Escallonia rubra]|uniref:Glycosyltransferase n=1 Tax=Escallonia rubra TaxID=112253 RepID=A0AA88QNE5_9ASTE|nr:hypothetical protein RJ640_024505 [Escallonia rubra]
MEATGEIFVVPFHGQGHLFPCMELCKHLSSRNFKTTLVIRSNLSSSVPSSFRHHHPLIEVAEIASTSPSSPPPPPPDMAAGPGSGDGPKGKHHDQELAEGIESFLKDKLEEPKRTRPACAVVDVMMSWSKEIFAKFGVPSVSLFTSGACSAAMEYAAWKAHAEDLKPGETRIIPGLPEDMVLTYSDLKGRPPRHNDGHGGPLGPHGPGGPKFGPPRMPDDGPHGAGHGGPPDGGPPGPGQPPPWLNEVEDSIALFINTCDDLEGPFIDQIANHVGKPVWGVGPLLPEKYWKSAGSLIHDGELRSNRQSNYTEEEIIRWLDSKPHASVIYIAFGSEVGPTLEEYAQLANALGESDTRFIWVIQPNAGHRGPPPGLFGDKPSSDAKEEGYHPHGLDGKVGDRGLVIRGWAPQLLILSHPSTGGFLSHCGWNSTVEAVGRGVPILAWPIRGDQIYNAKLVVCHLKVGYMVSTGEGQSEMVKKEDIVQGMEKLMADEEVHERALALRNEFGCGFPTSSVAALDAFADFISKSAS